MITGPDFWQFMPTKRFEPEEFAAFLRLLPPSLGDRPLRHALEVRHESFRDPRFVALAREHGAAIVFADSATHPAFADVTAPFVYARLQAARSDVETGYDEASLDRFAELARAWADGRAPAGLAYIAPDEPPPRQDRDVFVFMINGAKERAPAAAKALLARL